MPSIVFDPTRVQALLSEPERLRALARLQLLDTSADERFDRITRLAARLTGARVCLVSLIDGDRQFFKSAHGFQQGTSTPLSHSFCQYSVASEAPLCVDDADAHPVLRDNGAVRDFGVGAYLGVPLRTSDGHVVGTLCLLELEAREWTAHDRRILEDLAASVVAEAELLVAARDLEAANGRMAHRAGVIEELLDELTVLREEERRRLAGAVHDGPLQDVIAALMVLRDTGEAPQLALACLESANSSLRGIMDGLAPLQLPHADIAGQLVETVEGIARCYGVEASCHIDLHAGHASTEAKLLVHRATAELARNACRHSGSPWVRVRVTQVEREVTVAVTDGGEGWNGARPAGAGLNLLAEELARVGGSVGAGVGADGFCVSARMPLADEFDDGGDPERRHDERLARVA